MHHNLNVQSLAPNLQDKLAEELTLIAYQCLNAISLFSPIATGAMQKSFTSGQGFATVESKSATEITVAFGSPLWGKPQGYAAYVEFGTRPHWPPLQPLIDWVRTKGLASRSSDIEYVGGRTRKVRGQSTRDYQDAKIVRIARAIQRSIAARGTRPQQFAAEAFATMGLEHEVVKSSTDIYYQVDPSNLLIRSGAFERIMT